MLLSYFMGLPPKQKYRNESGFSTLVPWWGERRLRKKKGRTGRDASLSFMGEA